MAVKVEVETQRQEEERVKTYYYNEHSITIK